MILFRDLLRRLRLSRLWIAAQFSGIALLILLGIMWTRVPEKHLWQVAITFLLPLLLAAAAFWLQAATMRSFVGENGKRVKLCWGAASLVVWLIVAWIAWIFLDLCDDRIPQWAGYLNSQAPAHLRARLLSYEHIQRGLTVIEWLLRWIVLPGKIIPCAIASAQRGWRLPLRHLRNLFLNGRWWLAIVVAALASIWLPGHLFASDPTGTVPAQIAKVTFKLIATYCLAVSSWVLLLSWAAVLFGSLPSLTESEENGAWVQRLLTSRRWIGLLFGWVIFSELVSLILNWLPNGIGSQSWILIPIRLLLIAALYVFFVALVRSLLNDGSKRTRLIWGLLLALVWAVPILMSLFLASLLKLPDAWAMLGFAVLPVVLIPFIESTANWGWRLPWRKSLRLLRNWRWWLSALLAVFAAALVAVALSDTPGGSDTAITWGSELKACGKGLLEIAIGVLLLSWEATLFAQSSPSPSVSEKQEAIEK